MAKTVTVLEATRVRVNDLGAEGLFIAKGWSNRDRGQAAQRGAFNSKRCAYGSFVLTFHVGATKSVTFRRTVVAFVLVDEISAGGNNGIS